MRNSKQILTVLLFGLVAGFSSCKKDEPDPPSLYTRLGGITAIEAVTDQFLANVAGDAMINGQFAATVADPYRLQSLRNHLVDQICEAAGGPCKYKGKSMQAAHAGMAITEADFNALVGDLVASLNQFSVSQTDQNDLLTILGSLKPEIVGQ